MRQTITCLFIPKKARIAVRRSPQPRDFHRSFASFTATISCFHRAESALTAVPDCFVRCLLSVVRCLLTKTLHTKLYTLHRNL